MENGNADNLIRRIRNDAEMAAAKVHADAEASCGEIAKARDARIVAQRAAAERSRETQTDVILDGARTRAALDGRKEALADKRALLDAVFQTARENMRDLPQATRIKLYGAILKNEAAAGDTVAPASADRAALAAAVESLPFAVTISEKDAAIDGGFVLYGSGYEKDCSTDAILAELRTAEESNVAKLLFR